MHGDQVCLRCDGEGRQVWDEGGVRCLDACYACMGRGWVDEDAAHVQRLAVACEHLGALRAAEYRRWRDLDPEGEGFALCAAENALSPREYEWSLATSYAYDAMRDVAAWSVERQEWLLAFAEWPWREPSRERASGGW